MPFELGPESQIKWDLLVFRDEHIDKQRHIKGYITHFQMLSMVIPRSWDWD